jgi:hypothetical protein
MEVLALLVGGPNEARRYSSLAEARDDYLWYQHNGERDTANDGEIVGWAWTGEKAGDRSTADWVLRRGPRGGLRWDKRVDLDETATSG